MDKIKHYSMEGNNLTYHDKEKSNKIFVKLTRFMFHVSVELFFSIQILLDVGCGQFKFIVFNSGILNWPQPCSADYFRKRHLTSFLALCGAWRVKSVCLCAIVGRAGRTLGCWWTVQYTAMQEAFKSSLSIYMTIAFSRSLALSLISIPPLYLTVSFACSVRGRYQLRWTGRRVRVWFMGRWARESHFIGRIHI